MMKSQHIADAQIRQMGFDLLTQSLGVTGMIRFFQQSEWGRGDYTVAG